MCTAAYKVDVASDRRRRENVPRHILCSIKKSNVQEAENVYFSDKTG